MIVAGIGLRADATLDSLLDAVAMAQSAARGAVREVSALAAPEDKCGHPALHALSAKLKLPLVPISDAALRSTPTPTQAERVIAKRGTGSVAEAAALVAAGPKAHLLCPRTISTDRMATCAIAEGDLL